MSGQIIRVVPFTNYDWEHVAAGQEVTTFVAKHIDVSQFRHATLAIRVHSHNIPGDGTVHVQVVPDGSTLEDPTAEFFDTNALQTVDIVAGDTTPFYRTLELTAGRIGSMVSVAIGATMDSSQSQAMDAKISVDLVLKD